MIIPLQPPTFAVVEYLQISQHIWNCVETLAEEGDYRIICFTSDAIEADDARPAQSQSPTNALVQHLPSQHPRQ